MQSMRSRQDHVIATDRNSAPVSDVSHEPAVPECSNAYITDARGESTETVKIKNSTYVYSEFRFRTEEKFLVLPRNVRVHIERVLLAWLLKDPRARLCLGDVLGMALTVLAHAAHHIYMDWNRFLATTADDDTLLRAIRCFKTSVPEPGTYVGEIVAQFFQHCKQQSNLNVKRKLNSRDVAPSSSTGVELQSGGRHEPKSDKKTRRTAMDRKFETIMSLKRVPEVVVTFRAIQNAPLETRTDRRTSTAVIPQTALMRYLTTRVFGTLCYSDGTCFLNRLQHEFTIHEYNDTAGRPVYFSLEIVRKTKYDQILDLVFESVHLYNCSTETVNHRMGACNVVFCSDTLYFMDMSKRLFIDNSVTYIYCFLTDKYKPVIESREETDAFGLAKILASVEYSTKCSLKRNHSTRMGHGPLTSVISEGGLNESAKFVNNLMRDYILSEESKPEDAGRCDEAQEYVPQSPTYSPCSPAYLPDQSPTDDRSLSRPLVSQTPTADERPALDPVTGDDASKRVYFINEPYVNAFLNRPVECGNMY